MSSLATLTLDEFKETYPAFANLKLRVNQATQKASVIDVIRFITGYNSSDASNYLNRLHWRFGKRISYETIRINGKGLKTPVCKISLLPLLIEVITKIQNRGTRSKEHKQSQQAIAEKRVGVTFTCKECNQYCTLDTSGKASTEYRWGSKYTADVAFVVDNNVKAIVEVLATSKVSTKKAAAFDAAGVPWCEVYAGDVIDAILEGKPTAAAIRHSLCPYCIAIQGNRQVLCKPKKRKVSTFDQVEYSLRTIRARLSKIPLGKFVKDKETADMLESIVCDAKWLMDAYR